MWSSEVAKVKITWLLKVLYSDGFQICAALDIGDSYIDGTAAIKAPDDSMNKSS